ncbi:MAG TPA: hypothetical protein VLM89_17750, partial [Phycisphaerae bacterium]|nr:hypothetical protein [Phycisphaerae bacterium]
ASDATSDRKRLLAIWAWLGLLPVWLLADWDRIGYPAAYFIETSYAAGLLAALLVCDVYRRLAEHPVARTCVVAVGCLALAQTALGTADDCIGSGSFSRWTGIANKPAELRHDIGAKAAGWYVRRHVPIDAAILCLHDNKGMETSVAEYYLGRRVLAGFDMKAETLPAILAAMKDTADVVIVDARHRELIEATNHAKATGRLRTSGASQTRATQEHGGPSPPYHYHRVCVIREGDKPIRFIYARPGLGLPEIDIQTAQANRQYDESYRPRRVPIPLPAAGGFDAKLRQYQKVCAQLRDTTCQP